MKYVKHKNVGFRSGKHTHESVLESACDSNDVCGVRVQPLVGFALRMQGPVRDQHTACSEGLASQKQITVNNKNEITSDRKATGSPWQHTCNTFLTQNHKSCSNKCNTLS